MTEMTAPTNSAVAERLGLSESGVSLIRAGKRRPGVARMVTIEAVYGWPVAEQVAARTAGTYADEFERRIQTHGS